MTGGYMSTRAAAEYLGLTYKAFDMHVRRQGIPFKWFGGLRRFAKADLERAMEAMSRRPKARKAVTA